MREKRAFPSISRGRESRPALRESTPRALARPRGRTAWAAAAAALLAGCGDVPNGGPQDVDEKPGTYPVQVVQSSFPADQSLVRRSTMEIVVRNAGRKVIPNATVTLGNTAQPRGPAGEKFGARRVGTFDRRRIDRDLDDPTRPQFVLNRAPIDYIRQKTAPNGSVVQGEVRADTGDDPTYVDTYSLGPLRPGKRVRFRWNVTAVEAGPYRVVWRVHAGQDGRAKAVLAGGGLPRGTFAGEVSRDPPKSRVDFDDAATVDTR